MSIDTNDEKLALMEPNVWDAGIPMDEDTPFGTGDLLQLLWEYPFDVIPDDDEESGVPRVPPPPIRRPPEDTNDRRRRIPETLRVD